MRPVRGRGVENIMRVWLQSDSLDREAGRYAYSRYQYRIRIVSARYAFGVQTGCGAFAALSPNNDEAGNFRSLEYMMRDFREGLYLHEVTGVTTYPANREKAWRILRGEPALEVLGGLKVRAFYTCLVDPEDPAAVVVDGHTYSVWCGKRLILDDAACSSREYEQCASDFRVVAPLLGLRPSQLQATCWFTWRRIHRIKYQPQFPLNLGELESGIAFESETKGEDNDGRNG